MPRRSQDGSGGGASTQACAVGAKTTTIEARLSGLGKGSDHIRATEPQKIWGKGWLGGGTRARLGRVRKLIGYKKYLVLPRSEMM